jgi:hypothetical protein
VARGNNHGAVVSVMQRRQQFLRAATEKFGDGEEQASFIWTPWLKKEHLRSLSKSRIYNRMDGNWHLSNKKALFKNLYAYYVKLGLDPFEVAIPLTFHIKSAADQEFRRF